MFNYNCQGQRFLKLVDDRLEILELDKVIGVREITMEERRDLYLQ